MTTLLESTGGQHQSQSNWREGLPWLHRAYLAVFSALVSMVSVALPFFSNLATSLQSQNLYLGQALAQGSLPYVEAFSTGGLLYHALMGLAAYLGGTFWLVPVQAVCLYLSGRYLYKISYYLTQLQPLSLVISLVFYLLNLALGFGGLYPIQFAQGFVLMGLWFLLTHLAGHRKDEIFIGYGLVMAIALFLEPRTLLFWLLAAVVLAGHHIRRGLWARGFYQHLASIFGFILVTYFFGYFMLNMQLLSPYIRQVLLYHLSQFQLNQPTSLLGAGLQLLVFVACGFLPSLWVGWTRSRQNSHQGLILLLASLSLSVYLVYALASLSTDLYHLLPVLPFALILLGVTLADRDITPAYQAKRERRRQRQSQLATIWLAYLKQGFYLPILVLLLGLAQPIWTYASHLSTYRERQDIGQYLKEQLSQDQLIQVWDDRASIYLTSQALSATQFPVVTVNTAKASYQDLLIDQLMQGGASYIVVNRELALPSALQEELNRYYQEVPLDQLSQFQVYQQTD